MHYLFSINFLDRFLLIGVGIFIVGIIFFIKYIISSIATSIQRILHPLPWYSESLLRKYLLSILFLFIAFIGSIWIYSAYILQHYQGIKRTSVVGTIEIKKGVSNKFVAKFASSDSNAAYPVIIKEMRGDQWAVAGIFLDFPDFFEIIGLKDCHKVLGFVSKNVKEFPLNESMYLQRIQYKPDEFWSSVYKLGNYLKINVANFYLSSFTKPENGVYEIYSSNSGYLLKKLGKK